MFLPWRAEGQVLGGVGLRFDCRKPLTETELALLQARGECEAAKLETAARAEETKRLLGLLAPNANAGTRLATLTGREIQVLRLIADGHTAAEVAQTLSLARSTAKTYRMRLVWKLGLRGTADLVRFALAHGLVGDGR